MTRANAQAQPPAGPTTFVSSDMLALASHMSDCQRSHGPFFELRSAFATLKALASGRIVTTGAMFAAAAGICLLLAFN